MVPLTPAGSLSLTHGYKASFSLVLVRHLWVLSWQQGLGSQEDQPERLCLLGLQSSVAGTEITVGGSQPVVSCKPILESPKSEVRDHILFSRPWEKELLTSMLAALPL